MVARRPFRLKREKQLGEAFHLHTPEESNFANDARDHASSVCFFLKSALLGMESFG